MLRKKIPKRPHSFRLSETDRKDMDKIAIHYGLDSATQWLERQIRKAIKRIKK